MGVSTILPLFSRVSNALNMKRIVFYRFIVNDRLMYSRVCVCVFICFLVSDFGLKKALYESGDL
jgi:cell division protein FtsL